MGEVVAAVVEHLVGPEGEHVVELAGVVDPGHVRTGLLGDLDRERAGAAAAAIDEHPRAGPGTGGPLQGDRPRLGDGRRLDEGERRRFGREHRRGCHGVLGEAALEPRLSPYTSSPGRKAVTSEPTATTRPAMSEPSSAGRGGAGHRSGRRRGSRPGSPSRTGSPRSRAPGRAPGRVSGSAVRRGPGGARRAGRSGRTRRPSPGFDLRACGDGRCPSVPRYSGGAHCTHRHPVWVTRGGWYG